MNGDTYQTIEGPSKGQFKNKGSRFLAFAYPVNSEEDARNILQNLRKEYHDARHHCYAWVLNAPGDQTRSSDDGEPSGTAGRPILQQILARNLTFTAVFVVRYFGGVLLGTGGLIEAYREAASCALDQAKIVNRELKRSFKLQFPYTSMNHVMTVLKESGLEPYNQVFELNCSLKVDVRLNSCQSFLRNFELYPDITVTE